MEKPTLLITVEGTVNTGKSTIAALITQALFAQGIDNVSLYDENMREEWINDQPKRLKALADKGLEAIIVVNQVRKIG